MGCSFVVMFICVRLRLCVCLLMFGLIVNVTCCFSRVLYYIVLLRLIGGCCLGTKVVWLFYCVWVMTLCVCLIYVCLFDWLFFGLIVSWLLGCLLCCFVLIVVFGYLLLVCFWFMVVIGFITCWFVCVCYVFVLLLMNSVCLPCDDCYFCEV